MRIDHPRASDLPGLRKLWQQAFGDTEEYLDLFFGLAYDPKNSLCATEDGHVAAALYWLEGQHRGRPVAYVYAVATDAAFRGRGLCRGLTEHTHRILTDRGFAGAILVPAEPELFPMYEKMGYRTCARVNQWETPAGKPITLTELTAEAYAARRRELLPPEAVIQEGKTLALLAAMGRFYAGSGCLLTAIRDGDSLWVPELLGDPGNAPGIVAALGAKQGKFRGPGNRLPFAMYCTLDGSPAPAYLGFALD